MGVKELIKRGSVQYKANLHCHSTCSDGHKTPQQLKEMYREKGYSILAITDHETPLAHNDLNESDFLMLTGYEAHIRLDPSGVYDIYAPEAHLNLFAKDPNNETLICFNPNYTRYLWRHKSEEEVHRVGSERTREFTAAYIQEYINTARENGYLVAYNHPYWSMESQERILSYDGIFSLEIINGGAHISSRLEYNAALYDSFLRAGKRLYCHGGDDNHNSHPDDDPYECDSFRAFTYILSDNLQYDSVIKALENGDFYASRGPQIHALSAEGRNIHVECSPAAHVYVYTGSKAPLRVHAAPGACLTVADFTVDECAKYVRVSVFDEKGDSADTRGFFPDELGWDTPDCKEEC